MNPARSEIRDGGASGLHLAAIDANGLGRNGTVDAG
jgi:hypothetical protein